MAVPRAVGVKAVVLLSMALLAGTPTVAGRLAVPDLNGPLYL
jgi:hypothetical protein